MNIIFAHDHKLRYIDGKYYTLGGLSDTVTKRYTKLFGDVTIICRAVGKQKFDKKLFEITNPQVKVSPIFCNSLLISSKDRKRIKEEVKIADAVIVRLPSFIGEIVFKYAKELHKPILAEVVTCPWDSYWNHGVKGKIVAPYMWFKTRLSVKKSDFVVYVTQFFLQRRYPTEGVQIGCSDVELKVFEDGILNQRLSKIAAWDRNRSFTIGTLAALDTEFKGQQYVIEALSILKKQGLRIQYRLAGGGPADYLISVAKKFCVEDQVIIDGVVPHEKVFEWVDDLDLYIQPSLQEGLPRALIEAMSRACPAVGSTAGGIPELLGDECIFAKKDVRGIARALSGISNEFLASKAKINYQRALTYDKGILDIRREDFYIQFRNTIK